MIGGAIQAEIGSRTRLLVVEDDPVTRSMIVNYFSNEGFEVEEASTASDGRALMKRRVADLVFLDIHLPDANGLDFAKEIRASSSVGIIFVTQRDSETDRVVGLESAGDDYVTKPVNLRELLARARALIRRRQLDLGSKVRGTVLCFGSWVLDLTRRELTPRSGDPIQLTRGEFDLLAALVEGNGRTLNRDYLAEVISNRPQEGDIRTVDSLVARLRRKMDSAATGPGIIQTVKGIGYRLGVAVDPI